MKQTYDIAKKVIKIKTTKYFHSDNQLEVIINLATQIKTLFLEWKRVWSGQTLPFKQRR